MRSTYDDWLEQPYLDREEEEEGEEDEREPEEPRDYSERDYDFWADEYFLRD